jgi:hypothetical protein
MSSKFPNSGNWKDKYMYGKKVKNMKQEYGIHFFGEDWDARPTYFTARDILEDYEQFQIEPGESGMPLGFQTGPSAALTTPKRRATARAPPSKKSLHTPVPAASRNSQMATRTPRYEVSQDFCQLSWQSQQHAQDTCTWLIKNSWRDCCSGIHPGYAGTIDSSGHSCAFGRVYVQKGNEDAQIAEQAYGHQETAAGM